MRCAGCRATFFVEPQAEEDLSPDALFRPYAGVSDAAADAGLRGMGLGMDLRGAGRP